MIDMIKSNSFKKKIAIISIIVILGCICVGIYVYRKTNIQTEFISANSKNLAIEEEIIPEIKEEVILVAKDSTIDESLKEEETVKVGNKEVKVPKSTVAPTNSAEDAEKNKKNGGAAVSQEQAESMFENVGTKSFGIDVSAHQGNINWAAVKASGVEFAMIRVGFRGQSVGQIYEDNKFKTNISGAIANGIKVGIYFYSTAVNETEALEEAIWVTKMISTYRITYPVVYDFEDFGAYRCANVGGAQATSNAITFLNFVKSAGYDPMMYANKNDITTRLNRANFQNYKFWLAHYTTQTDYSGLKHMWQYTSKGSVPGISGNVDMNIAYFSYATTAAPKHTHNYSTVMKTTAATCSKEGNKLLECSCGETTNEVIPKLAHKFGSWTVVTEATITTEGLEHRICSVCNAEETKNIEKLTDNSNTNTNVPDNTNTNTNTDSNTNTNTTTPSGSDLTNTSTPSTPGDSGDTGNAGNTGNDNNSDTGDNQNNSDDENKNSEN